MVIDPADPDTRSDGSFFMNPVLAPTSKFAQTWHAGKTAALSRPATR